MSSGEELETHSGDSHLAFHPKSRMSGLGEVPLMPAGSITAFWVLSFLFVITPGADWAYAISAGLRNRVLPAVAGLLAGHLAATAVVVAGVGTLLAGAPVALAVLTVAGAAYLVWLGIGTLARPSVPTAGEEQASASWWRWAARGAGVSGLNPKVFLLFLALLPQFTDPNADWPLASQIALLGLVHTASCAVVYTGVGVGARVVLGARPSAARIVTRVSGVAMILIGCFLLVEQVAHAASPVGA
jgi:threonine/homoserine/homoserine lactone efflux protein